MKTWCLLSGVIITLLELPSHFTHASRPASDAGRIAFEQSFSRLVRQRTFEMDEVLHYGTVAQLNGYNLRVQFVAPHRLMVERNDYAGVTIQVEGVTCHGPRRWHCRHVPLADPAPIVAMLLLPEGKSDEFGLQSVTYRLTDAGKSIIIRGRGDPWICPAHSHGCIPRNSDLAGAVYMARLALDPVTGLPVSYTSSVIGPTPAKRSTRQMIDFVYGRKVRIEIPRFPAWTCPVWDPPGTWCLKEPEA